MKLMRTANILAIIALPALLLVACGPEAGRARGGGEGGDGGNRPAMVVPKSKVFQ